MILIVVPVLRRPHRVRMLLDSIEENTPEPHRTLFVCSPEDREEIAAVDEAGAEHIETPDHRQHGDFARKINLAYRSTAEPLLFLGADDLKFHPGWVPKALARLTEGIGVVGTNDLTNRRTRRTHSTHSLVTREYVENFGTIDEPNQVLHEGYWHNFVDDELVGTAQHRGAYAHARDCYVEHLHPMGQKAPDDEVYALGISGFDRDRRLFQRRAAQWT